MGGLHPQVAQEGLWRLLSLESLEERHAFSLARITLFWLNEKVWASIPCHHNPSCRRQCLWNRDTRSGDFWGWKNKKRNDVFAGGAGGAAGGIDWEVGASRCKLLYTGWVNNKILLCSTGNYIQYPVISHNGKECKRECIYKYKWVTLL